jgi:hypothetical protein
MMNRMFEEFREDPAGGCGLLEEHWMFDDANLGEANFR